MLNERTTTNGPNQTYTHPVHTPNKPPSVLQSSTAVYLTSVKDKLTLREQKPV